MTTLSLPHPALVEGRRASSSLIAGASLSDGVAAATAATAASGPADASAATPGDLAFFTDEALFQACGVRIAFTCRAGGVSAPPFDGLNLGTHVGDDPQAVESNRRALLAAVGAPDAALVVPNQVHGTRVLELEDASPDALRSFRDQAAEGADALLVGVPDVAALLCFADCVPVIAVHPCGAFVVAHAGWRGAVDSIAALALRDLARAAAAASGADADAGTDAQASRVNVYLGPHICASCFETGPEVAARFRAEFGPVALRDERHVDLEAALRIQLERAGADPARIVSLGRCTRCEPDAFFSYRASGGTTGRHGALAIRVQA